MEVLKFQTWRQKVACIKLDTNKTYRRYIRFLHLGNVAQHVCPTFKSDRFMQQTVIDFGMTDGSLTIRLN